MPKEFKKNNKQNLMFASVILFVVLSCTLVINAVLHNSQAEWAIIPDIKFVGEYKIGDGEWHPVVQGEHISATKGDVKLKGVLEILDPEKCPVVGEIDVQFSEFETTKNGEKVTIISQQITSNVVMYKFLGYDHAPKYLLGTDDRGFDIIVYSFNGLKKSFLIAIIVSAICLSFGLVWGSISGYFGGNVDLFMERFCEILSGVPSTVVITLVVLLLGDTILTFGLALCMTGWLGIAGRTRTQFYRFKGREYILASRTLGSSDMRLIFRHILPNSLGTIVTSSVLSIPSVIFSESSLSYLGILKGSNSFGSVLSHNQTFIATRPMLIVFPAIIISLIMISFNLFGNGLRDALNPSLKGSE